MSLPIDKKEIAAWCRVNHVQRLVLFGSQAWGGVHPGSDCDLLVDFEPEYLPGLRFFSLQDELSEKLHCTVDLNTPGFLAAPIRDRANTEGIVLYAA